MTSPPSHRKRILFVGHLAGKQWFGAERSLLDLLRVADRELFDVSCMLPKPDYEYLEAAAQYSSRTTIFPYHWSSAARTLDQASVNQFVQIMQRDRIDLVHVNTVTLLEPLVAARRCGVPCVLHARELIDQDARLCKALGGDAALIIRGVRNNADFIIANSEATQRLYHAHVVLYNGVDLDRFDLVNRPEPGRLAVGLICNNLAKKGIEAFAELARRARQQRAGLDFVLIGPSPEEVASLDAPLRAPGYIQDPVQAMALVNVVLSLSQVPESFGRTTAEALAARRPVIGYARGATPELVRNGRDGYIVATDDLESVLDYLLALAADPAQVVTMGESARAWAAEQFSMPIFASRLNAIYSEIFSMVEMRRAGSDVVTTAASLPS